jgi:hypothetical protein
MARLSAIGNAFGRLFLLPGDLACNALGVGHADDRDLVRMLVNSLVWTAAAVVAVAIAV